MQSVKSMAATATACDSRSLKVQCAAGETPRFVAENKQALRSLMQLHPLNLTKADHATVSQPPSPNPLLDTNPFGAVPLSALVHLPTDSPKKRPVGGPPADEGHFGAAPNDSAMHTPKGPARDEDEDVHGARQPSVFLRQAAVPAASFKEMVEQQVSLSAVLHVWVHCDNTSGACCACLLNSSCLCYSRVCCLEDAPDICRQRAWSEHPLAQQQPGTFGHCCLCVGTCATAFHLIHASIPTPPPLRCRKAWLRMLTHPEQHCDPGPGELRSRQLGAGPHPQEEACPAAPPAQTGGVPPATLAAPPAQT